MLEVTFEYANEHLIELVDLLITGKQDEIIFEYKGHILKIQRCEKQEENNMTDKEKIEKWAYLNKIKKDDEVVTTKDGDPVIVKKSELNKWAQPRPETAKRIGIAEGKIILPPGFDEWFDAMDAEILK